MPDLCDDGNPVPCAKHAPAGMAAADTFLKSVVPQIMKSPAYKADGMIAITFDNAPQSGPQPDASACCYQPTYPNLPSPPAGSGTGPATATTTTPSGITTTSTTTTTATSTTSTTTTSPSSTSTGTTTTGTHTTTATGHHHHYDGHHHFDDSALHHGIRILLSHRRRRRGGAVVLSKYAAAGQLDVTDLFNHFSVLASVETIFGLSKLGYASTPLLPIFGLAVFPNYRPQ